MKFRILFVIFILAIIFTSEAQKAIPELWGQRIHDEAKILQASTIDNLEHTLRTFEDSTSNQIGVLIVPSLEGEVIEEYTLRVAEKWKLGTKSKDNGVLFLVSVEDHQIRIEVGQGLQGKLTDALCSRIIRDEVAPAFRRNAYDEGVISAVRSITLAIKGEYTASAEAEDNTGWIIFGVVFGLFCIGMLIYSFATEGKGSPSDSSRNSSSGKSSSSSSSLSSDFGSSFGSSSSSFSGGGGSFDGGGSSGKW